MQRECRTDSEAIQKLDTANFIIKRKRKKLFVNGCKCNSLTSTRGILVTSTWDTFGYYDEK
jgi:hypothetical protein